MTTDKIVRDACNAGGAFTEKVVRAFQARQALFEPPSVPPNMLLPFKPTSGRKPRGTHRR
jgi:hypothetical protein